jgi:VCBS repeat protein
VAVVDVNGDGQPDMIAAISCSGENACPGERAVAVFSWRWRRTFPSSANFDSGGGSVTGVDVADLNADVKPDLVIRTGPGQHRSAPQRHSTVLRLGLIQRDGDWTSAFFSVL